MHLSQVSPVSVMTVKGLYKYISLSINIASKRMTWGEIIIHYVMYFMLLAFEIYLSLDFFVD